MNWSKIAYGFGVFVLLVVITFIVFMFLPKGKNYYEICKFPALRQLTEAEHLTNAYQKPTTLTDIINAAWIEYSAVVKSNEQKADLATKLNMREIEKTKIIPVYGAGAQTTHFMIIRDYLNKIPDIIRGFICVVPPEIETKNNHGYAEIANGSIRCVLPLSISADKKSGVWVDGETKMLRDGEMIIYDHSREHSIFNRHMIKDTVLLVFDIKRPESIPFGISKRERDADYNLWV